MPTRKKREPLTVENMYDSYDETDEEEFIYPVFDARHKGKGEKEAEEELDFKINRLRSLFTRKDDQETIKRPERECEDARAEARRW